MSRREGDRTFTEPALTRILHTGLRTTSTALRNCTRHLFFATLHGHPAAQLAAAASLSHTATSAAAAAAPSAAAAAPSAAAPRPAVTGAHHDAPGAFPGASPGASFGAERSFASIALAALGAAAEGRGGAMVGADDDARAAAGWLASGVLCALMHRNPDLRRMLLRLPASALDAPLTSAAAAAAAAAPSAAAVSEPASERGAVVGTSERGAVVGTSERGAVVGTTEGGAVVGTTERSSGGLFRWLVAMTLRPADHAATTTATSTKTPSPLIRLSLLQTLMAWLRGSAEAVAQLLAPTTALPALLEALEAALAEPAEDVHVRGHLGALLGLLLATAPTASFERPVLVRMVRRRLGLDRYEAAWEGMRAHGAYEAALDGREEWWASDEETDVLMHRAASTHQALLYADGLAAILERTYDAARVVVFEAYAEPTEGGNGGTATAPATTRASLAPSLALRLAAARDGSSTSGDADAPPDALPDAAAAAAAAAKDDPDTLALESFKALVVVQDETNRTITRDLIGTAAASASGSRVGGVPPGPRLLDLCPELKFAILVHVADFRHLVQASGTCAELRRLALDDLLWHRLYEARFGDPPPWARDAHAAAGSAAAAAPTAASAAAAFRRRHQEELRAAREAERSRRAAREAAAAARFPPGGMPMGPWPGGGDGMFHGGMPYGGGMVPGILGGDFDRIPGGGLPPPFGPNPFGGRGGPYGGGGLPFGGGGLPFGGGGLPAGPGGFLPPGAVPPGARHDLISPLLDPDGMSGMGGGLGGGMGGKGRGRGRGGGRGGFFPTMPGGGGGFDGWDPAGGML